MSSCAASETPIESANSLSFPVEGMSCAGCAAGLEKKLAAMDGVTTAAVNFALSRADVTFDADVLDTGVIRSTIVDAGYQIPSLSRSLDIGGMSCGGCVSGVEKALLGVTGVISADINLAMEKAEVNTAPGVHAESLIAAVEAAGFTAAIPGSASTQEEKINTPIWKTTGFQLLAAVVLSAPLVLQMVLMLFGVKPILSPWMEWLLATPVQFWIGARFYKGALRAIKSRAGNMDVLVALGTSAAYFFSVAMLIAGVNGHLYFESAAVIITLVLLGKWLESRAKSSATSSIRELMALRPETVNLLQDNTETVIPIVRVQVGDLVLVRPGERVPVDGIIETGAGEIDESLITGESMPVMRQTGDPVTGGSINGNGALRIRVNAVGQDTMLSRVIEIVENAQSGKAPVQRLVDKVSAIFVPVVLLLAALTFSGWLLAGGGFEQALIAAVSVLVIACPCALGLATPTALVAGTGIAARFGILIRDIDTLERACQVDTVVFDKTGTLTEGRPAVTAVEFVGEEQGILGLAASLQSDSEHPLAKALVRYVKKTDEPLFAVRNFNNYVGQGVAGEVNGKLVLIGNRSLMDDHNVIMDPAEAVYDRCQSAGTTAVVIAVDGVCEAIVAFSDPVKEQSALAVARLKAQAISVSVLSGDAKPVTKALANLLALDHWQAEQKPADKSAAIQQLKDHGKVVAMVGDGVNDAPALALADVGIAMGSGTDVAIESSGITLLRSDPELVPAAIDIASATRRKIYQNLFWAFIYNLVGIPLAAFGLLTPAIAGAAMAMSSVSVVSNALLLKRWSPDKPIATSD